MEDVTTTNADVTVEAQPDAITQAQANADALIKKAQRKESEANERLRRAQELEAQAEARLAAVGSQGQDEELDELAKVEKFIDERVEKKLQAAQAKTEQQKVNEVINNFIDKNGVSEEQMSTIISYFEANSIVPANPVALEKALIKAKADLFDKKDEGIEAVIARLEKEGRVVTVDKKKTTVNEPPAKPQIDSMSARMVRFLKKE